MMLPLPKYVSLLLIGVAIVLVGTLFELKSPPSAVEAATSSSITGWAWSGDDGGTSGARIGTGWLSLNCETGGPTGNNICTTRNYGLTLNADGTVAGYAWSDYAGWIQFGGFSSFPIASAAVPAQSYTIVLDESGDGTCGANCWRVPTNWNSSNNSIEVIGAGGRGNHNGDTGAGGSGGGAYAKISNLSLTPGASVSYSIGAGTSGTATDNDTWFNGATFAASSVGARGGAGNSGNSGGAGGPASTSIGTVKFDGGDGANRQNSNNGGGGGGAGGGSAAGIDATDGSKTGGAGNGGLSCGGAGATADNQGSAGTNLTGTVGSGGDGGGGGLGQGP